MNFIFGNRLTNVFPSSFTSSKYPFDVASTVVKSLSVATVDTVLSSSFLTLSNSLFKLLICSVCVLIVAPKLFGTCAFIVPSISQPNEMLVLLANVRSFICWSCGNGMNWGWEAGYFTIKFDSFKLFLNLSKVSSPLSVRTLTWLLITPGVSPVQSYCYLRDFWHKYSGKIVWFFGPSIRFLWWDHLIKSNF